jgi:hypothetical protein
MNTNPQNLRPSTDEQPEFLGGLPVRTDLRAGLAWDDLDDQAAALWQQLSDSVSNAVSSISGGGDAAA